MGTPQVFGIQGFDLILGTGGRITLDIDQTRYSNDRITAYFDITSCIYLISNLKGLIKLSQNWILHPSGL